MKSYLMKTK